MYDNEDFSSPENTLGFKTSYEGVGVYVFRAPNRNNKWYVVTLQGDGKTPVVRYAQNLGKSITAANSCTIDIQESTRTGIRVHINQDEIATEIMDSGEVSYKSCAIVPKKKREWERYWFALATKNSKDHTKAMQLTDLDIHEISWRVPDESNVPDQQRLDAMKDYMLGEKAFGSNNNEPLFPHDLLAIKMKHELKMQ